MRNYIEIRGGINKRISLDDGVNVPLNLSASDIQDISKRKGGFSKTIVLSGTKEINQIFSHLYEVNLTEATFNRELRIAATLFQDEIPVIEGWIRLLKINKSSESHNSLEQKITWEVVLYDDTANFFSLLEGNIRDLDFSDLNHTWDLPTIRASIENPNLSNGWLYILPKAVQETVGETNIGIMPVSKPVGLWYTIDQFYPAITVRKYLDKIFESVNFSYSITENGLLHIDNLIIPPTIDRLVDAEFGWEAPYSNTDTSNPGYPDLRPVKQMGSTILMNQFALDMPQRDFIKSLFTIFNLYVEYNSTNQNSVVIRTRDAYFQDGQNKDWTEKILKNKNIEIGWASDERKKSTLFTYKQGKRGIIDFYNLETAQISGQQRVVFNNEYTTGEDKIEVSFNPFLNERVSAAGSRFYYPYARREYPNPEDKDINLVYIDIVEPRDDFDDASIPAVIITGFALDAFQTYNLTDVTGINSNMYEYIPQANYLKYNIVSHQFPFRVPVIDLNFGTNPFYAIPGLNTTDSNVFNLFYKKQFNQLANAKTMTAFFDLTSSDFYNLNLNDRIWVKDSWWNIVDVKDYNANKRTPTRVKLIQEIDSLSFSEQMMVFKVEPEELGVEEEATIRNNQSSFISNSKLEQARQANTWEEGAGAAIVTGQGNTIRKGTNNAIISGNNNDVTGDNVVVIGDNQTVTEDNVFVAPKMIVEELQADNIITPDGIEKVYEITLNKSEINTLHTTPIVIPVADLGVVLGQGYKILSVDVEFDNDGDPFVMTGGQQIFIYDDTNYAVGLPYFEIDEFFVELPQPQWAITSNLTHKTYIITNDDLKIDATDSISGGDTNATIKFKFHYKVYIP
jgi:hypothetical protein